jgi:predicted amidohydrolase
MNITAIVAQFPVTLSIQHNLEVIDSVLEQTSPGNLVVFPEGSVSGYSTDPSGINQSR